MLDDVQRGRFLVEPTGEDAVPAPVGLLHVELDKGAGQLFGFPRSGGLACTQANDHVLPADRLAGMKRDVLDDPVALVEDSKDGDALRHGRYSAFAVGGRCDLRGLRKRRVLLLALAARSERERGKQCCGDPRHAYSGIQGS